LRSSSGVKLLDKEKVVEQARCYAGKGFLCSESVLLAISDWLGVQSNLIPRIATGFGAGVGGCGSVCGAISGGVIALGLKFGRNEPKKQDKPSYWFAMELLKRFEREFGHITCRELTDCDFSAEAGLKKYAEQKLWDTKCKQYIAGTTAMAFDIISEK
jgi:C_GCAxxG_C_C family probable redox protein